MTDKTSGDEDRGGLGGMLLLGAGVAAVVFGLGYAVATVRTASGFGRAARPCEGCAGRARQAADAEAEAYADDMEAAAAEAAVNGSGPADVTAGAGSASVG